MPSKVVFVNRFFYPDESASSQLLTDLALHLSSSGVRVTVITSRSAQGVSHGLPLQEQFRGIDISRVPTAAGRSRSTFGKLLQYASFYPGCLFAMLKIVKRGDLVVAKTDPPLISVVSAVVTKAKGAKLLNWLQDIYPEVATALGTPVVSIVEKPLLYLRNISLRIAAANVVIGSNMSQRVAGLGVPPDKIREIPNWADEQAIKPISLTSSHARQAWGFSGSDFVIGYSGNLGQAHEIDTLIGAADILRHRANVKFLFVGGGRQHAQLQSRIQELDLKNFIFLPHQPRNELSDTLAAADVHWLSLRPELEGLIVPSKLYGILAAGRPVLAVCDRKGEASRLVREHRCGFVIQPGDAPALARSIEELADNEVLRQSMGHRAREASEQKYSKVQSLTSWSRLISTLVPGDMSREGSARDHRDCCISD